MEEISVQCIHENQATSGANNEECIEENQEMARIMVSILIYLLQLVI